MCILQAVSEGSQVSKQDDHSSSQTDQNLMRSDAKFNYQMSVNGQALHGNYLNVHIQQGDESQALNSASTGETQVYSCGFCYSVYNLTTVF